MAGKCNEVNTAVVGLLKSNRHKTKLRNSCRVPKRRLCRGRNSLNLEVALEVAEYFRLNKEAGEAIISEVVASVKHWREVAAKYGISKNGMLSMEKAFSHF